MSLVEEMPNGVGAAMIVDDNRPEWVHYSRRVATLKLRRVIEHTLQERAYIIGVSDSDDEVPHIEEFLTRAEIFKFEDFKGLSLSVRDKDEPNWKMVLSKLNSGDVLVTSQKSDNAEKSTHDEPIVIPITRLRRYYKSMKEFEKALFEPLSHFYREHPQNMEKLWNDSRNHFKKYENKEGWSKEDGRKDVEVFSGQLSEVTETNQFTSYIQQHGQTKLGYTYVHREINPWQTRKAVFAKNSKKRNSSGAGGMDLLLKSEANGCPVVGEVKVKDDKNAFIALLQAMTYAVELSTAKQLKRVKKHLPTHFGDLALKNASVEIAIFMVNPVDDKTLENVESLIETLNASGNCVGLTHITLMINENEKWNTP